MKSFSDCEQVILTDELLHRRKPTKDVNGGGNDGQNQKRNDDEIRHDGSAIMPAPFLVGIFVWKFDLKLRDQGTLWERQLNVRWRRRNENYSARARRRDGCDAEGAGGLQGAAAEIAGEDAARGGTSGRCDGLGNWGADGRLKNLLGRCCRCCCCV